MTRQVARKPARTAAGAVVDVAIRDAGPRCGAVLPVGSEIVKRAGEWIVPFARAGGARMSLTSCTPPERETVVNATDADELTRITTGQRRFITRLRKHPSCTEVRAR